MKKKNQRDYDRISALMALLQNDPEYAALYEDTLGKLRDAEDATDAAMVKALEDIKNAKTPEARNKAQDRYDALHRYRVDVLGGARDRMMDEDNPPSKKELDEIQRRIHEEAPVVAQSIKQSDEPAPSYDQPASTSVTIPPIGG